MLLPLSTVCLHRLENVSFDAIITSRSRTHCKLSSFTLHISQSYLFSFSHLQNIVFSIYKTMRRFPVSLPGDFVCHSLRLQNLLSISIPDCYPPQGWYLRQGGHTHTHAHLHIYSSQLALQPLGQVLPDQHSTSGQSQKWDQGRGLYPQQGTRVYFCHFIFNSCLLPPCI